MRKFFHALLAFCFLLPAVSLAQTYVDITYVGGDSETSNGANTDPLTLTFPTHGVDDFAIIQAMGSSAVGLEPVFAVTVATGWTELRTDNDTTGADRQTTVFYKKLTSASETNPVITISLSEEHSATLSIFRGVDTTTAFDATELFDVEANTDNPTNDQIDTVTEGAAIVLLLAQTQAGENDFVAPSGYTLGETNDTTVNADSNEYQAVAYLLEAGAAGTKTPGAWQNTGGSGTAESSMYTLALRPAEAATITYIGGNTVTANGANTDSLTPALPTHEAGDFGIVYAIGSSSAANPTTFALTVATGWTSLRTDNDTTGSDRTTHIWYKTFASGSETNPVITINVADEHSATVSVFRGLDSTDPFDVVEQYLTAVNTDLPTNSPITTATDNTAIVLLIGQTQSGTINYVAPSGYTLGEANDTGLADTNEFQAVAYLLDPGDANTYTPGAWQSTGGAGTAESSMYTLALRNGGFAGGGEEGNGVFFEQPIVMAQSTTAYTVTGSLNESGDVAGVACHKDETEPTISQVQAGDCTGDATAQAADTDSPAAGPFGFSLTLTPTTPFPVSDLYVTDGTTLVTLADEFLDPPATCGEDANEQCQFRMLTSIVGGSPVAIADLDYDNQSANFTVGEIITGGTSGDTALILADADGGATGTLQVKVLSGTFDDNEEISDPEGGTADANGTAAFYYAAGDVVVARAAMVPAGDTLIIDADGGFGYDFPAGFQYAYGIAIYDTSAEDYHAEEINYWVNNNQPGCVPLDASQVLPEDSAMDEINVSSLCDDLDEPNGDVLTYAVTNGTLPDGTSLDVDTGIISGSATTENLSVEVVTVTGTDKAGASAFIDLGLFVLNDYLTPDCTDGETVAECTTTWNTAAPWYDGVGISGTFACSLTVAEHDIISQIPVEGTTALPLAPISVVVSLGENYPGCIRPERPKNRVCMGIGFSCRN